MSADAKTTDATRTILIAIGLVAIATILWLITDALLIGFGAIVFATVLRTIAGPLQRRAGWSERWSVVAAVFGLLILAALLCWLFGAQAAHEFAELREQLPVATQKFKAWVERWPAGRTAIETLRQGTGNGEALSNLSTLAGAALGGVGNLLLIVFAGIYFALDPKLYRNGALRLLPPARLPRFADGPARVRPARRADHRVRPRPPPRVRQRSGGRALRRPHLHRGPAS